MKRSRGFTLLEALVATTLMGLLGAGVFQVLGSGNLLATRTISVATGRQAALLFTEELEQDLAGCAVVPGHKGPPVAISKDGRRLAFYRMDAKQSSLQITVCRPVEYALSGKPADGLDLHPVRDGHLLRGVALRDVRYTLVWPDPKHHLEAWLLDVEMAIQEEGGRGRLVTVKRAVDLVQPSSTLQGGTHALDQVPPGCFLFLEPVPPLDAFLATANLGPGVGPMTLTSGATDPVSP